MLAVGVLLLLAMSAEEPAAQPSVPSRGPGTAIPSPYPFAPFEDPDFAATAARFERQLAQATHVRGAVRAMCGPAPPPPPGQRADARAEARYYDLKSIEECVARNFLIAQADKAFPLLLDAIRRGDRDRASQAASDCGTAAFTVVREGICSGYAIGGGSEDLDAQPLAVERRALSQRVLASLLASGGPRSAVALDLLAEDTGVCIGLPEAVRAATPTLLKLLGAPRPPVRIPVHPHSANASWDVAFRVLSFGGADRSLAEQPMAAFLEYDASVSLAALAIARMGGDATAAVPRIARVIETIQVRPQAQLTQLQDAVDALIAIGKPARSALPSLARLLSRSDMPGCHSLGGRHFAQMVRAIATPADAATAVAVLAPLVRCNREAALTSTELPVVELLGELGPPARGVLLSMFRDDTRLVSERLETLRLARNAGYIPGDGDRRLAKLLEHKRDNPPPPAPAPLRLASALAACRADAGLPPAPAGSPHVAPPAWDQSVKGFPGCLATYLCGPSPDTYARTMQLCCQNAYGQDLPSYCAAGMPAQ